MNTNKDIVARYQYFAYTTVQCKTFFKERLIKMYIMYSMYVYMYSKCPKETIP